MFTPFLFFWLFISDAMHQLFVETAYRRSAVNGKRSAVYEIVDGNSFGGVPCVLNLFGFVR
jgi:hypothetical protein